MNCSKKFKVEPNSRVRLDDIDADYKGGYGDRNRAEADLAKYSRRMHDLQYLLYAENRRSLLIILQGMDGAGKDGTINHVLAAMNPQGCRVFAFKTPSVEELAHDFLWRISQATPRKGYVSVFNRSHYEDVLVARVHNLVPKKVWSKRYDQINAFEKHLADNGTEILKFYLHIDKDEQLARFRQRLADPKRQWKISESDFAERQYWNKYEKAYEEAVNKCSTDYAPWYVIPSNHKWFRNLAVSQIIVESLASLDMKLPPPTVDIQVIQKKY
ncbi:MAG TPA: polyphosphate kinase 2 family protein, partial [Candidatus Acidoferrales bacterium]|nr:polyphosphate kinase 2 family protein [Candidatus Acidoferrales bacterium]